MKIKGEYILDDIGGEKMAVPLTANEGSRAGLVKLNEVGAFLWEHLQEETTKEELVQAVTDVYEVETAKASLDVERFLDKLRVQDLIEE